MTTIRTHISKPDAKDASAGGAAFLGALGAIGASTCCILPLVLFGLGVSGAWVGNLTAFEPYRPVFLIIAVAALSWGFWKVYRQPACSTDDGCATDRSQRLVRVVLWVSSALVLIALFWNWIAPVVAPVLLGL
jgi:mercuric ion transport protein